MVDTSFVRQRDGFIPATNWYSLLIEQAIEILFIQLYPNPSTQRVAPSVPPQDFNYFFFLGSGRQF